MAFSGIDSRLRNQRFEQTARLVELIDGDVLENQFGIHRPYVD